MTTSNSMRVNASQHGRNIQPLPNDPSHCPGIHLDSRFMPALSIPGRGGAHKPLGLHATSLHGPNTKPKDPTAT